MSPEAIVPLGAGDPRAAGAVPAARPANENARLAALQSYRVLDSLPEPAFDDAALLASQICGAPMAFVNLIDKDRVWTKASAGVKAGATSRDVSFCAHAILDQGVFEVPDARKDSRFEKNPYVQGDPRIRFYAGAPLRDDQGHALGTVCVIDKDAHQLDDAQRSAMAALGRMVVAQLRLRISHMTLQESLMGLDPSAGVDGQVRRDVTNRISHVLSTPLTPMMLQLRTLRPYITDPRGLRALDVLDRNVTRLGSAVRDVLAFTSGKGAPKAEFGKPEPSASPAPDRPA